MTRRVAVLSDIHGVLPALEAVLAEPDVRAADLIVLTGDLAAGPMPAPTLEALAALGERAVWVRGNADRELVALAADQSPPVPDEVSRWAARQLRPAHLDRLAGLPHPVTLAIEGFGPVLFCHGTPRDDEEIVLVDSPLDRFDQVLSTVDDGVRTVVCGHTHMPFARLASGRMVVNPGSVGMPYGRSGAHWALLAGGGIQLRRTEFDLDTACRRIAAESSYPEAAAWAEYYLRAKATDREALEVFSRAAT
ncbi:metallophosphoesterase family protein [Crossiella sp. CA-258035]|uniref:metallophosphoesterase family protein n=1 Tax=Crossiella sp. CA-258035 TaxID=2981138 RepID=UPI0024BC6C60|nr:metallophosphoesterase family protein [Crossiella sp. CA-258035]WHT17098.1 metallophosphoesterase family protein [Crossiella sp. CA-258035]